MSGHGLIEIPHENAWGIELGLRTIPVKQQPRYAVNYKGYRTDWQSRVGADDELS
jgi:hypothetical protein